MLAKSMRLVVLLVPGIAAAQEATRPDTTPFHGGQWAAQFGLGFNVSSLGLLEFRSPMSALLVDAALSGHHAETHYGPSVVVDSRVTVTLRLGRRRYHSARAQGRVAAFHTVGVSAGFQHNAFTQPFGPPGASNGWNAGLFGDVGGSYLVSSNLSLGATAGLSLSYSHSKTTNPGSAPLRSWGIDGAAAVSFAATIYF
jgi:hypothetical protein